MFAIALLLSFNTPIFQFHISNLSTIFIRLAFSYSRIYLELTLNHSRYIYIIFEMFQIHSDSLFIINFQNFGLYESCYLCWNSNEFSHCEMKIA